MMSVDHTLTREQYSSKSALCVLFTILICLVSMVGALHAQVQNLITTENLKSGSPPSEWDIIGAGDPSIQGFATDISVNRSETVHFKVDTDAAQYRIDIYRLGYYGGMGARKVATLTPSVPLPQVQPACLTDDETGLIDCGNWSESASWTVPSTAVSGIYIGKLVRMDTGGASHIVFVVRDDDGGSDLLFQTSDTTWQAYNDYGGRRIEEPSNRAFKSSYNRPFVTRTNPDGMGSYNWLFHAEYPMVRWLEANGYNVSYFTGVDSDRRGSEILEHKVFLSLGHDEYWSGQQRANVEAARDAGVNLAFLSGNEVYRKTRWETSIDGAATPYRTLVCYKESNSDTKIDPLPDVWTGSWRDPRFSPPADGGRPENSLTGTLFTVCGLPSDPGTSIQVPETMGRLRFWRNTGIAALAAGQTATLGDRVLGYEANEDLDNGSRPSGLVRLSSTWLPNTLRLLGEDIVTGADIFGNGSATHSMTLYRASSGALVFSAGTVQWSWGLDGMHDNGGSEPDLDMQQATVNLFADMGVQPSSLQAGLSEAAPSTDFIPPTSAISHPQSGTVVNRGSNTTISGTAADAGGGIVGAVEISLDAGTTWHPAAGYENWTFSWTPQATGVVTILARAVDDSGNIGALSSAVNISVQEGSGTAARSIWNDGTLPANPSEQDSSALEVGVRFESEIDGYITGLRFYKSPQNTGQHTGHLWTGTGQLVATVTFANETASGWQEAAFPAPVPIAAHTTYIASYHTTVGYYAADSGYFAADSVDNWPLRALADGEDGGNGVFRYGTSGFPANSYNSSNYWVDVVFQTTVTADTTPPTVASSSPSDGASDVKSWASIAATFSEPMDASTLTGATVQVRDAANSSVGAAVSYDGATRTITVDPDQPLLGSATYTVAILGGPSGVKDLAGNPLASDYSWSFTTSAGGASASSLWDDSALPAIKSENDSSAVELGVKFRTEVEGRITALRFYKSPENRGPHTGRLWTRTGQLLASVTFNNETESGWQEAQLPASVPVLANTTYVASYHAPVGHYSQDHGYFAASGVTNGPLRALADGEDGGNGVYRYGSGVFPSQTYGASNYWVDVVFEPDVVQDTAAPTIVSTTPAVGASGVALATNITAAFSEPMNASTINSATLLLLDGANTPIPVGVAYAPATLTVTLDPSQPLLPGATYSVRILGGGIGVKDLAGNPLASDFSWTFTTTSQSADTEPPLVVSFAPASGGTGVSTGSNVAVTFSEPMNASTVLSSSFVLLDPQGVQVSAAVSYDGATGSAVLDPAQALTSSTTYTAVVLSGSSGVADLAGNRMENDFSWSFTTSAPSGDMTPPSILSVTPPQGASGVITRPYLSVKFNEAMDVSRMSTSNFTLRDGSGSSVPFQIAYKPEAMSTVLELSTPLGTAATYTATVKGGTGGVRDAAGNEMLSDFSWTFSTGISPTEGPGGPILLVTSSANPFSSYYAEILRNEGFNLFSVKDISAVTASILSAHDVVILGEMPLTTAQSSLFSNWVQAGGNLIAMRPDKQLAGLLGLVDLNLTAGEGYVRVDDSIPPGAGVVGETIQYHGTADLYALGDATGVATIYLDASTESPHPAVTLRSVGALGGQAAAFTFDLARSVVYTRQGNPAWAGQDRDGVAPIRSNDLFFGDALFDPQSDWVDLSKLAIPQADEQQRLLANLILQMNADRKPLPRFWYFPRNLKAAVIMTGDDHAGGGTSGRFDDFMAWSPTGCSVSDWECIRGTSYLFLDSPLTDSDAATYDAAGFEIGLHLSTSCSDFTASLLESYLTEQLATWGTLYSSVPSPVSNRTHCIAWSDYTSMAEAELHHGIRFDTNYYTYPGSWIQNRPGFMTGSGLPMRFARSSGEMLDVYQALTHMTDESGQAYPFTIDSLLTKALGPEGYYGAFVANMHTDAAMSADSNAILTSAQTRGVPIISSRQMLEWLDGRNSSSFSNLTWDGTHLTFNVNTAHGANGLRAMIPALDGARITEVKHEGSNVPFTVETIKGVQYATFDAVTGSYEVGFGSDTTPPAVVAFSPESGAGAVSTGTKVTVTFSEMMDVTTIDQANIQLLLDTNTVVPASLSYNGTTSTVTLSPSGPLAEGVTYTVIIRGGIGGVADLAGNFLIQDFTWSFSTLDGATPSRHSIWSDAALPSVIAVADSNSVELGVRFSSDADGYITALRFYKSAQNTGAHVGSLWTITGQLLASVTFTNETASGWQEAKLATPVPIAANTTYVASYHSSTGFYSADSRYFAGSSTTNGPLTAPADGQPYANGVYKYGSRGFPTETYNSTNYWVDVVFQTSLAQDTTPPQVAATNPVDGATEISLGVNPTATFSESMDTASISSNTVELSDLSGNPVPATVTYDSARKTVTLAPLAPLSAGATYTVRIVGGSEGVADAAGNVLSIDFSWTFTTLTELADPVSLWDDNVIPAIAAVSDPNAVELGMKFTSERDGYITGIRFYKSAQNSGPHVGNLWTAAGQLLETVSFVNETASGWQQVDLPTPVAITANTTYVVSYHTTVGYYSANSAYFSSSVPSNGPLRALANGENGGNGVYRYGASGFPSESYNSTNYWVDVVFHP